jgi:hypothetical protein
VLAGQVHCGILNRRTSSLLARSALLYREDPSRTCSCWSGSCCWTLHSQAQASEGFYADAAPLSCGATVQEFAEEQRSLTLSWCDGTRTSCMCDRTRSSVASSTALPAIAAASGTRSVSSLRQACISVAAPAAWTADVDVVGECHAIDRECVIKWRMQLHALKHGSSAAPVSINLLTDMCVFRTQNQRAVYQDTKVVMDTWQSMASRKLL